MSIWLTDLRRKRQQVRKPAPKWGGPAVLNNEFIELSSDKFIGAKGKWVVLFFYPLVNIPFPTKHPIVRTLCYLFSRLKSEPTPTRRETGKRACHSATFHYLAGM